MIKHVVLLNWKEGVTQEEISQVTSGFLVLMNEIKEIHTYQFGPDAGIYKGNANYVLVAEFKSEADLKTYVKHPEHQKFLAEVAGPMLEHFQSGQFLMTP